MHNHLIKYRCVGGDAVWHLSPGNVLVRTANDPRAYSSVSVVLWGRRIRWKESMELLVLRATCNAMAEMAHAIAALCDWSVVGTGAAVVHTCMHPP